MFGKKLLPSAEEETSSNTQASYNLNQILFRRACALQSQLCLAAKPAATVDCRFFVKFPCVVVVIARGLAVPTAGITGPLGNHKAGLWFPKQSEPFLGIAPTPPVRNLHWRMGNLAPVSREWGSISTWSWHIWPCLQQALSPFHPKLLQTVAAQRTAITTLDIWLLECFMT